MLHTHIDPHLGVREEGEVIEREKKGKMERWRRSERERTFIHPVVHFSSALRG